MTKTIIRTVNDHGTVYDALMFCCPGCKEFGGSGLHMLAVNATNTSPAWEWSGDLNTPTLSPSILSHIGEEVCHSFLKDGIFQYLGDCTHSLANKNVPMIDLPDWVIDDSDG